MKKITSLFTYVKKNADGTVVLDAKGNPVLMACINGDVFISATWLAVETKLPIHLLSLLIGSSIDVKHFIKGEELAKAVVDAKGVTTTEAKVCTDDNKIVKSFSVEPSFNLMVAMLTVDKLAA